jgi:ubiquitin C-terminal hydrolase
MCGKVKAAKSTFMVRLPNCLILHLKRHHRIGGFTWKLTTKISFSQFLDLTGYDPVNKTYDTGRYELRALAEHTNEAAPSNSACGHYVAYVSVGTDWYRCSDTCVTRLDLAAVLDAEAYLLFYERLPS